MLDLFELGDKVLQLVEPIDHEVRFLLQSGTLIDETSLVLQKCFKAFKPRIEFINAEVLVLCSMHEVFKDLGFTVQVFSLVFDKVFEVHVLDS